MTQDERHAQMVIALKLMREVVEDVENEALNSGESQPSEWEIWRHAGMNYRDNHVSWLVRIVRRLPYANREFRVTQRSADPQAEG